MDIGAFIKEYRNKNGLTLREFAKRSGTSHSYIAMLENSKNSKTGEPIVPSIIMLNKIAQAMAMPLNELIDVCDDIPVRLGDDFIANTQPKTTAPEELSEGEQLLLDLFRQIPEEQQKAFLQMGRLYADSLKKG